jgi:peptidoglycan/LPS O-acetylase OafA/YrhL
VHLTGVASPLGLFAIATPIVLAIAAVSWFVIERPALRLKQRSRPIETATAEAW